MNTQKLHYVYTIYIICWFFSHCDASHLTTPTGGNGMVTLVFLTSVTTQTHDLLIMPKKMTRQQLKNSGKLMKKSCMPKNDVTEEEVGEIEQGKFIESRNVMCYIACIYTMTQLVKNNKLSYDAVIKQVDVMFPAEMRDAVKASANHCKDITKKYKDLCEASYWTAKCMYDYDADNFVFP